MADRVEARLGAGPDDLVRSGQLDFEPDDAGVVEPRGAELADRQPRQADVHRDRRGRAVADVLVQGCLHREAG